MKKSLLVLTVLFLSVSHLLAQVPSYVPTDGLVGWWPFNGNANDESGNGNQLNNFFVDFITDFQRGNVANFNGNSWLESDTSLFHSQAPITFTFWAKTGNNYAMDIIGQACGNDCGDDLRVQLNAAQCGSTGLSFKSPAHFATAPGTIADSNWHFFSLILGSNGNYSYSNFQFFIDGIFIAIGPTQCSHNWGGWTYNPNQSYPMTIGKGGPLGFFYNGLLDDIAIYNRALSPEEIYGLYSSAPVSAPAACTALPSNLQQGLVGYWPFCGNANDESGNGNDGVVNGATLMEDRFGNAGSAYSFDGVDDFISVSNSESIDVQSEITITAWVKTTSIESSRPTIVCKERFENGIKYMLSIQSETGNVGIAVNNGPSTNCSACNQEIWSNESLISESWQHVSASWDNEILKVYVNGVLSQTGEGNLQGGLLPTAPSTPLLFGKAFTSVIPIYSTQFQGSLDDIGIWNRALTPEEVQELYTLDACTFTIYDTLTVENVINVYDTLTIENIVDVFDTTYINVEVYDTLTVENIVNVYDTLTIENVVTVYDTVFTNVENIINVYDTTYTNIENVIDVYDTTTVVETVFEYDTLTIENIVEVYDTLTVENVIDVYDTTTIVETVLIYDTLTVENVIDVYDTTYVTVTDTLIIDIPSGVGGTILNTLLLYPNPTSDQLTINYGNFAAMAGYSLTIFDNGGSTVHETNITQAQETLDISQWSAGVYQVVVYNTGGVPVETRQIVIQ